MNSCSSVAEMLLAESFVGKEIELKRIKIGNVDVAKAKEQEATVVEVVRALTADCAIDFNDFFQPYCRNGAGGELCNKGNGAEEDRERKCGHNGGMTQASATANGINSIVRGVSSSSLGDNISVCRGVATVPAETFMMNEVKQKRKVNVN